jgi:hypothetical protein
VRIGREDPRDAGEAGCGAGCADEEKRFAAELVDEAHADHGEDEVGEADGDGLLIAGELAESGRREDAVEVIEDGVDAGKLIECADGDGEEKRVAIFPAEDGLVRGGVLLGLKRGANVGELGLLDRDRPSA